MKHTAVQEGIMWIMCEKKQAWKLIEVFLFCYQFFLIYIILRS